MKIHIVLVSFMVVFCTSIRSMEQKSDDAVIIPYTTAEVHNYTVYNDLYYDHRTLIDLARDRTHNLSTIVSEQQAYKRLTVASQETKDAFLYSLQNRIMRQTHANIVKDEWPIIRTWIAICAMIHAKDDSRNLIVLGQDGSDGYANRLAQETQDHQLIEILAAYKERLKNN